MNKGSKHSFQTRLKMSIAAKRRRPNFLGKKHTLKARFKIRKARLLQGRIQEPALGHKVSLEIRLQWSKLRKGKRNSPATEFKKGHRPWNYGVRAWRKKFPYNLEQLDSQVQTDIKNQYDKWKKFYMKIHGWLRYNFGSADHCSNKFCPKNSSTFNWAKLKDKPYEKNRDYFIQLCVICHQLYDRSKEKSYHFHTVFLHGRHHRT